MTRQGVLERGTMRLKSPILRPTSRIHLGSLATPIGCDIRRQPIRLRRRLRCCRRTRGRFRFRSKARRSLNRRVRPGDVIVVPGGGDVMVVGWVHRPGYFKVGSGLTVMGAIGAAGGPMYAADTDDVTLIRSTPKGSKRVGPLNLKKISEDKESDRPVRGNDVIDVPYSGLRIGPFIFYSVLSRMGVGGPAIPAF